MDQLTGAQRETIREYLAHQGLSFQPLQDEMVDHLACDVELRMLEGHAFEKAWHQIRSEISENHFQTIQVEVMETINKRFTWSQGLSLGALALLLISTMFKILHFAFGGALLILSFVFIAASLLTPALSGVFLNRGKRGGARVLSVIGGILLLLLGYAFKVLHLSGADQIILMAAGLLIVSLLVNTIHVYRNSAGHGNLITYLHEKYTPGIERFFLILLLPLVLYKCVFIFGGVNVVYAGNFVLLIVMFGSGVQFIAMCWRIMEKELSRRNTLTLAATMLASVCLVLPFLGPIVPLEPRIVIIVLFSSVAGWLAYSMEEEPRKMISLVMVCLVPLIFIGWGLIHLGIITPSSANVFFNLPLLLILTAGLLLCRKHGAMRAYMLISLSSYVFEYIV